MKSTLRTHLVGLTCFMVAVTVSAAAVGISRKSLLVPETPAIATPPGPGAPEPRQYGRGSTGWVSCGGPSADRQWQGWAGSTEGWVYECSDGKTLTYVRYECRSTIGAVHELQARLDGFGGKPPRWDVWYDEPHRFGRLVSFTGQHHVDTNGGGPYRWAFVFTNGNDFVAIYGPSREHVTELLDANPLGKW